MTRYGAAAEAAWRLWRRDGALLWPLIGLTHFVPLLAKALFLPPLPALPSEAAGAVARLTLLAEFGRAHLPLLALIVVAQAFGRAALFTLYRAPGGQSLGQAIAAAAWLMPRYLLLVLLVTFATSLALLLFVLPALYLAGRFALAGPALVAAPDRPALAAIGESWRLTRGHGLMLMALVALAELVRALVERPLAAGRTALVAAGAEGDWGAALLGLGEAGAAATVLLAVALYQVALYRELAGRD